MNDHESTPSQVRYLGVLYLVDLFDRVSLMHAQLLHRECLIFLIGESPNTRVIPRPGRELAFPFDEGERNYVGSREYPIYAAGLSQCLEATLS